MRLNWIRSHEQVAEDTLQEVFVEPDQGIVMKGKLIKFCKVCRRWVSKHDYEDFCSAGMHEYAEEISLKIKGRDIGKIIEQ